jgi:hypothetical protein
VTVLLPLDPVMAATGAAASRANSSMSPITGTPRARAARIAGSSRETPGETTNSPAARKMRSSKPPRNSAVSGSSSRRLASPGGWARLSMTAAAIPRPAKKRAQDSPVLPRPTIRGRP